MQLYKSCTVWLVVFLCWVRALVGLQGNAWHEPDRPTVHFSVPRICSLTDCPLQQLFADYMQVASATLVGCVLALGAAGVAYRRAVLVALYTEGMVSRGRGLDDGCEKRRLSGNLASGREIFRNGSERNRKDLLRKEFHHCCAAYPGERQIDM